MKGFICCLLVSVALLSACAHLRPSAGSGRKPGRGSAAG